MNKFIYVLLLIVVQSQFSTVALGKQDGGGKSASFFTTFRERNPQLAHWGNAAILEDSVNAVGSEKIEDWKVRFPDFKSAYKEAYEDTLNEGGSFKYKINGSVFTFPIPKSFRNATWAYREQSEDPRLAMSLVCQFVPQQYIKSLFNENTLTVSEFLKIDILKMSKTSKATKREQREGIKAIKNTLPSITDRTDFSINEGIEIANDQIKRIHGNDSGFQIENITNLGIIHEDEKSLLWTYVMPMDLTIRGQRKQITLFAVMGVFFIDGRAFYISSATEFKEGLNLKSHQANAIAYIQEVLGSN